MVLWRPTRPFRTNTQKGCPFHYKGLECKSRKSRNIWSNRQIWSWNTEWSRAKANRVLPRECTGHSKHPLPTTQDKTLHMDITRWSTLKLDWLYSLQAKVEKLYTVSKNKTWSWLWLRSTTPYCKILQQYWPVIWFFGDIFVWFLYHVDADFIEWIWKCFILCSFLEYFEKDIRGFPDSSVGKESACNAGYPGLIPGLVRSPGEGKGYPFQYSGLENSMDSIVNGVAKNWTWPSDFHFHLRKIGVW